MYFCTEFSKSEFISGMGNVIKIKKGLDIKLKGKAPEAFIKVDISDSYAIVPDNYNGIKPKIVVRAGDKVLAGTTVMVDKDRPEIKFVSPVSGEITGVNRGEKRKVLSITIKPDRKYEYEKFEVKSDLLSYDEKGIKAVLLDAGIWPFIKQRPYDFVANPSDTPRDIFVTAYNSAPLAPDVDFIVKSENDILQLGLQALTKLTNGKVYLGVKPGSSLSNMPGVEVVELYGPHPVGNVGIMINKIKPVNKGETVWTMNAVDVLYIGRLFRKGIADFSRMVALTGSEVVEKGYAKVISGCKIGSLIDESNIVLANYHYRIISGNVLTGTKVCANDYLGAYDSQITVIPDGDDKHEFFGWASLGFNKFTMGNTFVSSYLGFLKREYVIDARIKGGRRAMIMSNEYDKVFPMDILPEYLLKAIIAFNIEKMEDLGIYEVAPEDFALCEVVDTSKIEIQKIVRDGLNLLYKEMK